MRNQLLRLVALGTGAASIMACAEPTSPEPPIVSTAPDGAQVTRSAFTALTGPSFAAHAEIVRGYVRPRIGAAADQLHVVAERPARGNLTHVQVEQRVDGLRVHGAYIKAAMTDRGELVQVVEHVVPASPVAPARIGESDALVAAFTRLGYQDSAPVALATVGQVTTFAITPSLYEPPSVERVAYADERGSLRAGFVVETWSLRGNQLDKTLVDGSGAVVSVEHLTASDRYNVFVEDPGKAAQTIVTGGTRPESPSGWLGTGTQTTHNITGNNVHAYLDTDANNRADTNTGATTVTNGDFLATANLTVTPASTTNRAVAVQNLFYLNNIAHDVLYRHGFNEAAGNFQTNNNGKGGRGADAVLAEAQDGSGLDNANFSTPAEGRAPRMQMFLWSGITGDSFVTAGGADINAFHSGFGGAISANGTAGALALAADSTAPTSDACEAIPAGSLTGKIALVDRGTCAFTVKVKNAQTAGAVAVVIINNAADGAFAPGGTDATVTIPSAMVSLANGTTLKAQIAVQARLRSNPSPLRLDGDVDSDVVFHEYAHGLTQRMVGGMSGPIAGAIGEGASDTNALLINGDDIMGEYAAGSSLGIRTQPYASYVGSYKVSVTGTEVHADGELYAAIMWRVKENYLAAGLTVSDVQDDWVDGLNFTPSTPAYENMRDGMLQGAAADRQCLIWEGFAHFGVGVGAKGTVNSNGTVTITESFTRPASCP